MCSAETLELIFVGVLVFVLICILWKHREVLVHILCGMPATCGGTKVDTVVDYLDKNINLERVVDVNDPIYAKQDSIHSKIMGSDIVYNGQTVRFDAYLAAVAGNASAINPSEIFTWASNALNAEQGDPIERQLVYTIVIGYYQKFIEMASGKIKEDLTKNMQDVTNTFAADITDMANSLSKKLIYDLLDVVNTTAIEEDERVTLSESDENSIMDELIVKKHMFKPMQEGEGRGMFGWMHKNKVAVGSGYNYGLYTNEDVQAMYGSDVHVVKHPKLRLEEILDGNLPVKIYLLRYISPGWLSKFSNNSPLYNDAVATREEAFKWIMEETKINFKGREMPFLEFILRWKHYSDLSSNDVYKWALDICAGIKANIQRKDDTEYIYTKYTIVMRYYRKIISIVSSNTMRVYKPENLTEQQKQDIAKHNAHVEVMLHNLRAGYAMIQKQFGDNMEHYSTLYINSLARDFEKIIKRIFPPHIFNLKNVEKIGASIMEQLHKIAKQQKKVAAFFKNTAKIGTNTGMLPNEQALSNENPLKGRDMDVIDFEGIELKQSVSAVAYKDHRTKRLPSLWQNATVHVQ